MCCLDGTLTLYVNLMDYFSEDPVEIVEVVSTELPNLYPLHVNKLYPRFMPTLERIAFGCHPELR